MRLGQIGVEGEGLPMACLRLGQGALFLKSRPQVGQRAGMVWLEGQRASKRDYRLIELILEPEDVAQVVVGLGDGRLEAQRAPVAGDGCIQLALARQDVAQVVQRIAEFRVQHERPAVGTRGILQPAQALEGCAEVAMERGRALADGDRLADQLDGAVVVTCLERDQAEQMQAAGMPGIHGEHLAVELFGRTKLSRLVKPLGLSEPLGDRPGRCGRGQSGGRIPQTCRPSLLAVHGAVSKGCGGDRAYEPPTRLRSASTSARRTARSSLILKIAT